MQHPSTQESHTMDCQDIQALLSALIDDELDAETRHVAERHVADCPDCREVLDELEYAETVLAADIDRLCELPVGFESAVLEQTAYADRRRRLRGFVTWSGWFATAASLTVATLALWWSDTSNTAAPDRQAAASQGADSRADNEPSRGGSSDRSIMTTSYGTGWELRAFIDEDRIFERPGAESTPWEPGDREVERRPSIDLTPQPHSLVGEMEGDDGYHASLYEDHDGSPRREGPDRDESRREARPAETGPAAPADEVVGPPEPGAEPPAAESSTRNSSDRLPARPITRADGETLHATTILLEMLEDADNDTFADIERIRRIAESDDVLERLATVRYRVPIEHRPVIMAAEGILLRAVNGPLSLEDLEDLQEASSRMGLPGQLDALIQRRTSSESL